MFHTIAHAWCTNKPPNIRPTLSFAARILVLKNSKEKRRNSRWLGIVHLLLKQTQKFFDFIHGTCLIFEAIKRSRITYFRSGRFSECQTAMGKQLSMQPVKTQMKR